MGPVIESQRIGPETEEHAYAQPRTHQTDIGLWYIVYKELSKYNKDNRYSIRRSARRVLFLNNYQ